MTAMTCSRQQGHAQSRQGLLQPLNMQQGHETHLKLDSLSVSANFEISLFNSDEVAEFALPAAPTASAPRN